MVFSSFNNTSYLPLDNDQSVTFYKNENRLFPTAIVPPTVLALPPSSRGSDPSTAIPLGHMSNMSTTDMLTAAYEQQQQQQHHHHHHHLQRELIGGSGSGSLITGDCPFGRVQSPAASATQQQHPVAQHQHHHHRPGGAVAMCDDFQPIAYLNGSSNGYYGYVPALTPASAGQNNRQNREETGLHQLQAPAAVAPPEVLLPSARFHGNGGCCDDNELNNNNNNNNDTFGGEVAGSDPFSAGSFLQHARKRKENGGFTTNAHHRYDEEMDTNAPAHTFDGASETKRRKREPEPAFPVFDIGDPHGREQQQQTVEMECQEQQDQHHLNGHSHPKQPQPPPPVLNYTNGIYWPGGLQPASSPFATAPGAPDGHQHQHHPTSKSKYFDSSRCMMSHMI